MKNYRKNDANTKVRIIKPILDDWNDCITDTWMVEKDQYCEGHVIVRRKAVGPGSKSSLHGNLAHELACICEAYDWCWAIYHDAEKGIHIML